MHPAEGSAMRPGRPCVGQRRAAARGPAHRPASSATPVDSQPGAVHHLFLDARESHPPARAACFPRLHRAAARRRLPRRRRTCRIRRPAQAASVLRLLHCDRELRLLARKRRGAVVFGKRHVDGLLLACAHASEARFEVGEHAPCAQHDRNAFAAAAFERLAVDRALEIDSDTIGVRASRSTRRVGRPLFAQILDHRIDISQRDFRRRARGSRDSRRPRARSAAALRTPRGI